MNPSHRIQWSQIIVLLLLLFLVGVGAVPHYGAGTWTGAKVPPLAQVKILRDLRETGLEVPGWTTVQATTMEFGDRRWSQQLLQGQASPQTAAAEPLPPVLLLILPQKHGSDRPQVEWTDLQGVQGWTEDQHHRVDLVAGSGSQVTARWFRGWRQANDGTLPTFAVLQWYAWDRGGHWSPNVWFWRDWQRQWRKQRLPWVAVSVVIPMEPLGNLDLMWSLAESLGQKIQENIEKVLQAA